MTKTNKTLLCVLLALVMTFALALTALTVADTQTAKAEGEATYTKVTEAPTDWSGTYILVCEDKKIAWVGTDTGSDNPTVEIVDNKITFAASVTVEIESMTGGYSIKVNGGTNDGKYIYGTQNSNKINFGDTPTANTISLETITSNTSVLRCNASSGQFRYYKSSSYTSQKAVQLYKLADSTGGETEEGTVAVTVNGKALKADPSSKYFELANGARLDFVTLEDNNVLKPSGDYEITLSGGDSVTKENYLVKIDGVEATFEEDNKTISGTAAADANTLEITFECRHNAITPKGAKEATCTEAGYEASWECDECGTLFDSAEKTNVIEAATVIPALGHEYVNGVCSRCGDEKADYEILPSDFTNSYDKTETEKTVKSGLKITETYVRIYSQQISIGKTDGVIYIDMAVAKVEKIKITNGSHIVIQETSDGATYTDISLTGEYYVVSGGTTKVRLKSDGAGYGTADKIEIWTVPEVPASKFEIEQTISAGEDSKEGMVTTESGEVKTIYIAPNGQIVVTYKITANEGINTFIGTLNYDKNLFQIVSVSVTDIFGEGAAIKSGKYDVDDFKVYVEGDGTGFNKTATGEFIVVTYKYIGTTASVLTGAEFGFVEGSVECYTNSTSGHVNAEVTVNAPAEKLDLIKTATITIYTTEFVYNGTDLVGAVGKGEADKIHVTISGEGALTYKWYTDSTYATEVEEGYAVKNAGSYYLKVVVAETAEYQGNEATATIVIKPYDLKNADSEIVVTADDKQQTGEAITWEASELHINGGNLATALGYENNAVANIYTVTIAEHSITAVGSQKVNVTITLNANYVYGTETTITRQVTLTVVEYANRWTTEPQNIAKDFDNVAIEFDKLAIPEHGTVTYYLNDQVITLEELANAVINAGTYTVKYLVQVAGYSDLSKTVTITINKLKVVGDSIVFDYGTAGKVKWSHPTQVKSENGEAKPLPTTVEFTYTLQDGETKEYGKDDTLEYTANAEGQYILTVKVSDEINYEGVSVTLTNAVAISFAEGTHELTEEKAVEGKAAYNTIYRFEGQLAPAAPTDPSLTGYRFAGWDNTAPWGEAISASVKLTAQWVKTYVIAWNNDDGSALESKTVDAGTQIAYSLETAPTSELGTDDYYTYTFAGWQDGEEVRELGYTFTVNGDITVTAKYDSTLAYVDVAYTLTYGNDTTTTNTIAKVAIDTAVSAIAGLPELKAYTWFKNDGWKCGENAFTAAAANLANEEHVITITATYVFAIGNGDVDGSGTIDTKDITLYRQVIVGGYDITTVENAWATATAEGFAYVQGKFYLAAVANVDGDAENKTDIRDVSTIRMALVEGYGYEVKDGAVVVKGNTNALNSARSAAPKQVLAPMGLFGKKFAL